MRRVLTQDKSDTQIRSIFRAARFGDRTRCPRCGYARRSWKLDDGRWRCSRCRKRFGLLTDTWLSHTRFELAEIYELLFWFELELTDHGIARRLEVPYHRVHRFLLDLRRAIAAFEDRSIALLDGEVEVDESYFGPRFENRRRAHRSKLRKSGQVLSGRGAQRLKQAVFGIHERSDGIVYVEPVANVSRKTLQAIIHEKVSIKTVIHSDAWAAYKLLANDYVSHETVQHGTREFVRGSAPSAASKASGPTPRNASSATTASAPITSSSTSKKWSTASTTEASIPPTSPTTSSTSYSPTQFHELSSALS